MVITHKHDESFNDLNKRHRDECLINNMATTCFRNVADEDYIAARVCYKHRLTVQFNWMAQQAIEKYLKAILLFNGKKTKKFKHKLKPILDSINAIDNLKIQLSKPVVNFINYLDTHGVNRYLEKNHISNSKDIVHLDRTVWEIRMYCKVLNYNMKLRNGQKINMLQKELDRINKWKKTSNPNKFQLVTGHLEDVVKNKKNPQRSALIWKNLYFGVNNKHTVGILPYFKFTNPPYLKSKELFDLFNKFILFPSEVVKHFEKK